MGLVRGVVADELGKAASEPKVAIIVNVTLQLARNSYLSGRIGVDRSGSLKHSTRKPLGELVGNFAGSNPLADFESFFKFSTVHNPWARAVSLYFRKEGKPPSEIMDFESFCDQHFYASDTCKHPTLHRNQYDWLCDESGKPLMDYVGKLESISEALEEIARRTNNRLGLKFQHENQNQRSQASSYRDLYNERTKKIIASRFEKDIDYFKYTF